MESRSELIPCKHLNYEAGEPFHYYIRVEGGNPDAVPTVVQQCDKRGRMYGYQLDCLEAGHRTCYEPVVSTGEFV